MRTCHECGHEIAPGMAVIRSIHFTRVHFHRECYALHVHADAS